MNLDVAAMPKDWPMPTDISVTTATLADRDDWDQFVGAQDDDAGYHAFDWQEVFGRAFGHESVYLIARRAGAVAGVLPLVQIKSLLFGRTLTSLPFLNSGGVLADSTESGQALIAASLREAQARRCGHVELRHVAAQFPSLPSKQHKVSMRLPLAPGLWDRLDRKVRNQIRKAEKSGLTVERGGGELVDDFYDVFARNMRDLGTPVYTRRLFDEVFRVFPERATMHMVRLDGRPVAAGVTYRTARMTQLPWASSVRDYNSLCPNTLLYWDTIQFAADAGCQVFDMGRSTPHESTFKFKQQWGASPVPLHWEYQLQLEHELPNLSPANPKFRLAIALWQKLPLALTSRVGPIIVRAIP